MDTQMWGAVFWLPAPVPDWHIGHRGVHVDVEHLRRLEQFAQVRRVQGEAEVCGCQGSHGMGYGKR